MSRASRLSACIDGSSRSVRAVLLAPAVAGAMLLGALPAVAAPTPTPTPSTQQSAPSAGDVDAAHAAEAAAAKKVAQLQSRYDEAATSLRAIQGQVSETSTAYARAVADLEGATTAADLARARAATTQEAADAADRMVRQDAAAAYMQGGGPMNHWAIFLSADGLQELMDLRADIDAIGSVHQGHLADATFTASVAATDRASAEVAHRKQSKATAAVEAKLVAVQHKAEEASAAATRIQAEQEEMVAELAAAHRSTVAAEQARQDALVAALKVAAAAGPGPGSLPPSASGGPLPLVGSGGSADLTAAQVDPRAVAREMVLRSFDASQWGCLDRLWNAESGWRWSAQNPSSGAYGIPQSLPGSKMASAGADWLVNPRTQITWGLDYIGSRYGTPCNAWASFQSRSPHWY